VIDITSPQIAILGARGRIEHFEFFAGGSA
jgi:hypothetical protein